MCVCSIAASVAGEPLLLHTIQVSLGALARCHCSTLPTHTHTSTYLFTTHPCALLGVACLMDPSRKLSNSLVTVVKASQVVARLPSPPHPTRAPPAVPSLPCLPLPSPLHALHHPICEENSRLLLERKKSSLSSPLEECCWTCGRDSSTPFSTQWLTVWTANAHPNPCRPSLPLHHSAQTMAPFAPSGPIHLICPILTIGGATTLLSVPYTPNRGAMAH